MERQEPGRGTVKRLSAKYDACLLDLVALGAPQRVTGISDEARKQ